MKINNITLPVYSFKGIKVSREQKQIDTTPPKSPQEQILDEWGRNLTILNDLLRSKGTKKSREINSSIEQKYLLNPGLFTDTKHKFDEKQTAYQHHQDSLKERLKCADQMVEVSDEAAEKIDYSYGNNDGEDVFQQKTQNKGLSKIAGYETELDVLKKEFIERVKAEKSGQDVDIFGSILFFGPYSNGKTYITKAIAEETGCNIVSIKPKAITPEKIQETMKKILKTAEESEKKFQKDRTRTVIFIDEADKLIGNGSPISDEFENFIKICSKKYHCSVFAATNEPLSLSVNMYNPEVFPIKMSIDPPMGSNIEDMFMFALSPYSTEKDIDYEAVSDALKQRENETKRKFSNGQITSMCDDIAVKAKGKPVTQDDIIEYIQTAVPEISEELSKKFDDDYNKLIKG